MPWVLTVIHTDGRTDDIPMQSTDVQVGRSENNDIVIAHSSISRHHLRINWNHKRQTWVIRDLGSSNGTTVRGEALKEKETRAVESDMSFILGNIEVKLREIEDRSKFQVAATLAPQSLASLEAPTNIIVGAGKRQQTISGIVFALLLSSSIIYSFINTYLQTAIQDPTQRLENPWVIVAQLFLLIIYALVARYTCLSAKDIGLTLERSKQAMLEVLVLGGLLAVVLISIKKSMISFGYTTETILFHNIEEFVTPQTLLAYLTVAFVQELLARGIFISAIERCMAGPHRTHWAILLSALGFGSAHLWSSLVFGLATTACGVLFAMLFVRHRTLIGVTIIHWVGGSLFYCLYFPYL